MRGYSLPAGRTFTPPAGAAPAITTASPLPGGNVSAAYSQTIAASGGALPLVWSVISGAVPAGCALSAAGVLSGTPTTASTYIFVAQVRDNVGRVATKTFGCTIAAALGPTNLFVAGGQSGGTFNYAFSMAIQTGVWTRLADMPGVKGNVLQGGVGPSQIDKLTGGASGKIAFTGGETTRTRLYVYDIATNAWTDLNIDSGGDNMVGAGVLTSSGRYMIGWDYGSPQTYAYNPTTNLIENVAAAPAILRYPMYVGLASGKAVWVPLYHIDTCVWTDDGGVGSWAYGPAMNMVHSPYGSMLRLADGRIMVIGQGRVELNNPTLGVAWAYDTNPPASEQLGHCLLPDGRVVFAGQDLAGTMKIYIYTPGAWSPGDAPTLHPGSWITATALTTSACNVPRMDYSTVTGKVYIVQPPSGKVDAWDPVADSIVNYQLPVADMGLSWIGGCLY